ncbi:SDR family NAD(P)-dependent oxidoreductase [Aliagarivorans marinus]|uniref:SDR family NAD(P)-dependent oxidoreductase n=1 Tax=Aliagarivorans marinus TaxID=561965 RepID=UPI000479028B|nr:SDR family NAD(P)-dependent oxidoreductase [Aliagarivorans marinus]
MSSVPSSVPQTILITGCSSGIGLYSVQQLQQDERFTVIASCRNPKDVARLNQQGIRCVQLDLDDEASIEQGWQHALELAGGKLSALFNNGAYGQCGALEDLPTQALRQQFESNFFGWHHLSRLAIAHMLEQGEGRIIQNSSVLGLVAMPHRGAYIASKFALEGYTDTLRLELADTPIQISLIEPGPIRSAFRQNALSVFQRTIDSAASRHRLAYQGTIDRLAKPGDSNRFTLGPEAVHQSLLKALLSQRAKPRYCVTFPTYLFTFLRRILPTRRLDNLLVKG